MKPDAFNKQIQKGDIPPISLLYGEESLLIQETIAQIRRKLFRGDESSLAQEIFHGSETDASTILGSAGMVSLFSRKKLIVVKGIDKMPVAQQERLLDYLQKPALETTLVLTAQKPDMRKKFFSRLQKQWPAVRFYHPYDERQTEGWMRSYLKKKGYSITSQAARSLCESHGRELQVLQNELEKLMLYKGEKGEIGTDEVAEISGQSREFNPFEFADVVADRDLEGALRILTRLTDEGAPPLLILAALSAKLRKLWMGKALEREGNTDQEILRTLKINFKGGRFLSQLRGFNEEKLKRCYARLLTLDEAIKTGRNRPTTGIEHLVHLICRNSLSSGSKAVHLAGQR